MFSGRVSRSQAVGFAIAASAVVAALEQACLVRSLLRRYTNEDHAVLWLAASDWMHLRPREPTFYGQPYGVNFEAIPIGLLHLAGASFGTALPVALIGMALSAWWLLAWAAARRGMWFAALVAAAAPLLLSTDHWVITGVIGTGVGRLLATVAAALALIPRQSTTTIALVVAIGGYAAAIDPAAMIIAGPVLVWAMFDWFRVRRFWLAVLAGGLVPLAWKAGLAWYETIQPDHALHSGWGFDPGFDPLAENYANWSRLFGAHSFELLHDGDVFVWACAIFFALAIASLQLRAVLAVLTYAGLLAYLAALPKSLDGTASLWFPHARMTIASPAGLWFIGAVSVDAFVARASSSSAHTLSLTARFATVVLAMLALGTSITRARDWSARIAAIETVGLARDNLPLHVHEVGELYALCDRARQAAQRSGTRIVLFPYDRTANYACPALHRGLLTAAPDYERRHWVLRSLSVKQADRMIVWGLSPKECWRNKRFRSDLKACAPVGDNEGLLLQFEPRPALDMWRQLGNRIRPFGPGCHPASREGCDWWAARYDS